MGFWSKVRKARNEAAAKKYDKHGNSFSSFDSYRKYTNAGGQVYNSREEALDTRVSGGIETKKDNKSVFGAKRANLFGN